MAELPQTRVDGRPVADPNGDLGFGSVVARESRQRLLNRDGTFNVRREGLGLWSSLSVYHYMLTISWPRFFGWVAGSFLLANGLFALAYVACGSHALTGFESEPVELRLTQAFFFSVQTLATIGYGSISPANLAANIVVTIESLVGLLAFGLVAGLMFARFARPMARIIFSRHGVVAPYHGKTAFMFRIVNQKNNELVELEAKVLLARRKKDRGTGEREFIALALERDRVAFFPLSWTVVHPIDERSPMYGISAEEFHQQDAEILVMVNGFDETFSQTVHARSSYRADEIVWGARFRTMFNPPHPDGTISVDIRRLHDYDSA